ncbi:MAG: outer membrane beta-barrel protein [Planctomycetes bacterium]|nr:outer membrane beta-barrel protein [Planctomycetota bacterium]
MKLSHVVWAMMLLGALSCVSPTSATRDPSFDDPMHFDPVVYPASMGGFVTTIGLSEMQEDSWGSFDFPIYVGVAYLQKLGMDPLQMEIGWNYNHEKIGGGSSPEERLRFFVVDLGVGVAIPLTKSKNNVFEPYVGGGLAFLFARKDEEVGLEIEHFQDGDQGYYMHAGLRMHIEGGQYLSVDWRWLRAVEVDLGAGLQSAESNSLSIGFGYSF